MSLSGDNDSGAGRRLYWSLERTYLLRDSDNGEDGDLTTLHPQRKNRTETNFPIVHS